MSSTSDVAKCAPHDDFKSFVILTSRQFALQSKTKTLRWRKYFNDIRCDCKMTSDDPRNYSRKLYEKIYLRHYHGKQDPLK